MISPLLRARTCLGISFGWDSLWAVAQRGSGAGGTIRWWRRLEAKKPLFDGRDYDHLRATLSELAGLLPQVYRKPTLRVQIALPDPVVNQVLFEFDSFPRKPAAAAKLVAWRYAKEFQVDPADTACSHQVLGQTADKTTVFCLAADRMLVSSIVESLREAGLVISVMDAMGCFQHNCFQEDYGPGDGALIAAAPDQWSLSLWDGEGRLQYLRGFWSAAGQARPAEMPRQIARIIKARARAKGTAAESTICLSGAAEDDDRLQTELRGKLRRRALRWPEGGTDIAGLPEQALMAAIHRCA